MMMRWGRLLFLTSFLFQQTTPFAFAKGNFDLPPPDTHVNLKGDNSILKQISASLSGVTESAGEALVFISVSKTLRGPQGGGYVDPFEFFFGNPRGMQQGQPPKQEGLGSGFFIDLDKGYIMTNNHVVGGADEIELKLANGFVGKGKVVGTDPNTEIAIVKVVDEKFNRKGLSALVLGDSDKLKKGDLVIALGAPFGLAASATLGVVSATDRDNMQVTRLGKLIQTDAAINPGNSGGPLVDMDGKAIGINTAIYSPSGAYAGIGFAVPASLARSIALSLVNEGSVSRGFIGVEFEPLLPEWIPNLNLPSGTSGVVVKKVTEDGPADKAGLKPNDVITEIEGKPVKNGEELVNSVGLTKPGTKLNVTYFRGGKKVQGKVEIGAWPGSESFAQKGEGGNEQKSGNDFGLVVGPDNRGRHLLIKKVDKDSPADQVGLQPGDAILAVNGSAEMVENANRFNQLLSKADAVLLLIERREHNRGQPERYLVRLARK